MGLATGLAAVLAAGFTVGLAAGVIVGPYRGTCGGCYRGILPQDFPWDLATGHTTGHAASFPEGHAARLSARGLAAGLATGLAASVAVGMVVGLAVGVALGLASAVIPRHAVDCLDIPWHVVPYRGTVRGILQHCPRHSTESPNNVSGQKERGERKLLQHNEDIPVLSFLFRVEQKQRNLFVSWIITGCGRMQPLLRTVVLPLF